MSIKSRLFTIVSVIFIIGVILFTTRHLGTTTQGLRPAFNAEFLTRPDGYQGLCEHYGFTFPIQPKQMADGLMYKALADGAVDVIDAFSTDGRIPAYNLFVLEDDKEFFPPYYGAPLVRQETLKKFSELKDILNQLAGRLSNKTMQKLNFEVDEHGRIAHDVAHEFLLSHGLIQGDFKSPDDFMGEVTIGSKEFTEQEIIGELMAILIEANSKIKVIRKLNLGSTMIAFNALKAGDIDLYAEYTGTGLVTILKRDVISNPDKTYKIVKEEFSKRYNLMWLKPFGFNNTYTLTMRKVHAKTLGIETISDLAEYVSKTEPHISNRKTK